jgi:hypothetical protein
VGIGATVSYVATAKLRLTARGQALAGPVHEALVALSESVARLAEFDPTTSQRRFVLDEKPSSSDDAGRLRMAAGLGARDAVRGSRLPVLL